jgi:apolipoprotein N-acyltransferase
LISAQAVPATGATADRAGGFEGFRTRWALLIAVAGGLATFAAFPPTGIWPLAAVGPALLVLALTGRGLRASFGCGLAFGLALFVPLLSWLINEAWYAWAALAVALAVIFAVLTIGQRLLLRLRGWPVAVAGWWVAAEAVRDRWPYPFPWGRLAMSQAVAPDVRWVAVGGVPFLSFLVALAGAMLARAALAGLAANSSEPEPEPEPEPAPRSGSAPASGGIWSWAWARAGVAAAVTIGLVLAGGLLPVDPTGGAPTAQVAAIQGDVPRAQNLSAQLNDTEVTQNHAAATVSLANQVKAGQLAEPDLVVWPENSTDLDPYQTPFIYDDLAAAVAAVDRPILIGEVLQDPERNVGQLWVPGRGPTTLYVKRQLVPFGEYIPFRSLISSFSSLPSLQPDNFTPGHKAVVFNVGKIKLGDVICYEVGFDQLVRSEVTAGANLLAVQSNDADFEIDGQLGETEQQTAMARIRAVESDRAVVYVSTTGESSIIAPDGDLIVHSGIWQRAILDAQVPLVTYRTLADRVGAWPEYVIVLLTVLALAWAVVQPRRRRSRLDAS